MIRAIWNNQVIAESDKTIFIEGNHYFPKDSVIFSALRATSYTTTCPFKGMASYYDVVVGAEINQNAAWSYKIPKDSFKDIQGYIAFWNGVLIEEK